MRQAIIDERDLREITLVMYDWGGIIGLRTAAAHPDRFPRLVVSDAGLPARDPAEPSGEHEDALAERAESLKCLLAGGLSAPAKNVRKDPAH